VIAITVWLRGGMVLTGTSINLVTVQISSLAIGLGVDYAIHMVQRVREARYQNPHSSQEEWMSESLDETGNNIAMSAFTDFVGFMVLTLSIMPLFLTFGMIMAIMILLSFVAAVFMLPALLFQFGNLEGNRPPRINSVAPEPTPSFPKKKSRVVKKVMKRRS
jgi:predicted RND superfamily exporter protein